MQDEREEGDEHARHAGELPRMDLLKQALHTHRLGTPAKPLLGRGLRERERNNRQHAIEQAAQVLHLRGGLTKRDVVNQRLAQVEKGPQQLRATQRPILERSGEPCLGSGHGSDPAPQPAKLGRVLEG